MTQELAAIQYWEAKFNEQTDRIAELERKNTVLSASLEWFIEKYIAQKPLSDDEINQLSGNHIEIEWFDEGEYGMEYNIYGVKDLVRAVEERHGIK